MGKKQKTVTAVMVLVCIFSCILIAEAKETGGQYFVEKSSWQGSMLASRQVYVQNCTESVVELGPWHTTGWLKANNFSDVLFPEDGVDLKAKKENGKGLWTKNTEWADGKIHALSGSNKGATYLYRVITSHKASAVVVSLGSDDGIEVWLNGEKVLSHDVPRGVAADQERVELPLNAGKNEILMKIFNNSGGHGFYFSLFQDSGVVQLWKAIAKKYPVQAGSMEGDLGGNRHLKWFYGAKGVNVEKRMIGSVLRDLGVAGSKLKKEYDLLIKQNVSRDDRRWLDLYVKGSSYRDSLAKLKNINVKALRLAIADLDKMYGGKYKGKEYLRRLGKVEQLLAAGDGLSVEQVEDVVKLQYEILLSNPLLDFDKLLFVKRKNANKLGLPQNWQGNCSLPRKGYDDSICVLSPVGPEGEVSTLYKPAKDVFVGDVDLNFDGDKLLFSSIGTNNRWHVFELNADGTGLRQLTPEEGDIDNYDACYLPDGRIIFDSSCTFVGVPCVGGKDYVANLCIMDSDGEGIRQLTFDQDHDWCPVVLNNGRVLYTRWEYSDTSHYFTRLMFNMNPDGTNQVEYYGSNSFWPNSTFYARPIPNHPTQFVAIISGHHGVARMGEMVIFDPAKGRREADGVVQRIGGYQQKVEPVIKDQLVRNSWPKFLHPYPLSEKYFLVSCKPNPKAEWGIYLVDIFDNILLLQESAGYALLEPVPFRKIKKPPVIPDRVDLEKDDATVYIADIYFGDGLKDVPRGEVKKLRAYEFHYGYRNMGGHKNIAVEGTWDVHRIMGTVPVHEDGSALFKIPANTPIAIQPLDEDGSALQVMRSWFVGMPGENVSCIGCHEGQSSISIAKRTTALKKVPSEIKSWYGPTRGFSFKRDLQEPVLLKYCVGCHDGSKEGRPDLSVKSKNGWGNFTPAYLALHPYVRRPGPESDYHMEKPLEYHSNTSELVQMLKKGHHGVEMDEEGWDRLITWIDLNVPDHGTWSEHRAIKDNFHQRRIEMLTKYANRPEDPEFIPAIDHGDVEFIKPKPVAKQNGKKVTTSGWPFDEVAAKDMQKAAGAQTRKVIDLGGGVKMNMVLVPAGKFVMGSGDGALDEGPKKARIKKSFWMGELEVSNAQYKQFDAKHDSRYINQQHKDHTTPGYPANLPDQPVIRVNWNEAVSFCDWLSRKTGMKFELPTELQWEWACRAGSETEFFYGGFDSDFGKYANLADLSTRRLAVSGINPQPIKNPDKYLAWLPRENRFDDGERIVSTVGKYSANAWGLKDMHGNVCEWTKSIYKTNDDDSRVIRGGSWRDRPKRATSYFRWGYREYQKVYNVGFRVVSPAE